MRLYYLYILASRTRVLYIGVTGNFELRLIEHRTNKYPNAFTSQYNVNKPVYFEEYTCIEDAIVREKQLKGWRRSKKVALIEVKNPEVGGSGDGVAPPVIPSVVEGPGRRGGTRHVLRATPPPRSLDSRSG
jgi:putative endonuclease